MSMISAQIDELRERSKTLRQGRWSDGPDDAKLMEDAADTIWQLRDDLQRANTTVQDAKHDLSIFSGRIVELAAENAKLREQVHYLMKGDLLHVLTDQEYIDQCERERLMQVSIDALDKENAKLREQVDYMTPLALYEASEQERDRMRELGIEVD